MEALFIVLNHEKHVNNLLVEFDKNGLRGGTILESMGMAQTMAERSIGGSYAYLRNMLSGGRPYNKTIFLILDNDRLQLAKECVRKVVGDLGQENVGIMFNFPIGEIEGLTK